MDDVSDSLEKRPLDTWFRDCDEKTVTLRTRSLTYREKLWFEHQVLFNDTPEAVVFGLELDGQKLLDAQAELQKSYDSAASTTPKEYILCAAAGLFFIVLLVRKR